MFNPKYRILLTSKCFANDDVVGLGIQLISIINSIKDFLPQLTWCGANVDAIGKSTMKHFLNNIQLNVIGDDISFIEYCSEIEQFIWGVFLGIDSNFSIENIQNIELETEDKPFRSIACNGVLIEIRAFDTSYFELYSEDLELMEKLSKKYNVEIEQFKS